MAGRPQRDLEVRYLVGQAVLVVAWWFLLATVPDIRGWFELDGARPEVLDAFVVADLVLLAGGSVLSAVGLRRGNPWAGGALLFTVGCAAYATLYLGTWVLSGGHGWMGLAPMASATVITGWIATGWHRAR